MLYREPKVLKDFGWYDTEYQPSDVSVLYREPKVLKGAPSLGHEWRAQVSVLYREPKVLKGRAALVRCG